MKAAAAALVLACGVAHADDGDAFAAIGARLAHGELTTPAAIDAYEALGHAPVTRWTDDAWSEAARLAERAGDFARARTDLQAAIAASDDARLIARAHAGLARLGASAWDAVAADHDRLVRSLDDRGDPRPALASLEALARAHPTYPRGTSLRLALARGWEANGDADRAIAWLVDATGREDGGHARVELAHVLLRHDREARATIAAVDDPVTRALLADELDARVRRAHLHVALWLVLAALAVAAAAGVRRIGWRRIARPPGEVLFVAPIALVLAGVATTGNPLVARAVWTLAIAGVAIAWLSGALLAARPGRLWIAGVALVAAACVAYLALDHGSLATMIAETWRTGPQL